MRKRRVTPIWELENLARQAFRDFAKGKACAKCRTRRAAHSHHVVYEQELSRRGAALWDTRNALPLCFHCHNEHHKPGVRSDMRVPLGSLRPENINYAAEVLGDYAMDYLHKRYGTHDEATLVS